MMARTVVVGLLAAAMGWALLGCGGRGTASVGAQAEEALRPPAAPPLLFEPSGDLGFDAWRQDFAQRALAAGRDREAVERLLSGLAPDERAIRADRNQPELVRPWWDYVERAVTRARIAQGQAILREQRSLFSAVEERYGVPAGPILGIWALESNFGAAALPHHAPRVLATLAFEGRRRGDFERWLMALIEMVERGYAGPEELRSSWAGALGQPQFMPDVYLSRAVDWDGDGRRDIWRNNADVAASIANYLAQAGWRAGEPVFQEVRLAQGFDYGLADRTYRSLEAWREAGAVPLAEPGAGGGAGGGEAELFLPAGAAGPALLLYRNFAAIRRYNPSDRYALAVALMGRQIAGEPPLTQAWPAHLRPLTSAQSRALQEGLNALGHDAGAVDGVIGSATRQALRAFQAERGLLPDGFPTIAQLERVRAAAGGPADGALAPDEVARLQRLLERLGYRLGAPDGVVGPRTRNAIRAFERSLGRSRQAGEATVWVLRAAEEASAP
jgi:lytic murein transglycosylase